MPNFISENQIEKAILEVFINNLGYRHINAEHADTTGRANEQEVIIKPILRERLQQLNKDISDAVLEEVLEEIADQRTLLTGFMANKEIYHLLKDGKEVTFNNAEGRKITERVRVIDFDDETQNDYLVVSQLWLKHKTIPRRPDLIVFVNGIPLVFIELKNSNIKLRNAHTDNLTNYKKDIPLLFNYNAFCILSNGVETKVGSHSAGWEHFFPWLRVEDEKKNPDLERIKEFGVSLDYAVLGLCDKKRLLDYVENFILYYNDVVKVCAKNHQFLGVNNAVESFKERLEKDKLGDKKDRGKLGVFWHTQGSGKSYSMIFFSRKVFRKFTGNYTFVIVTDRDDLDDQIRRNFLHSGVISESDYKSQPNNSDALREKLKTNARFVFTLIQKFRYDKGKAYPVLSTRNDIVVIIDEAHRTQYKDLAENMRTGLPAAQYMAFTGTPLFGSRQLTNDWFGGTVSEYNFKQSVIDGATVPLFYQKRVPEVHLQNDQLDDDLADIVADENLTDEQQQKLEREHAQELSVLKADDRLETIAKDIVYHFPRRGYLGKGMVITIDKFTAVRMYDKVKRLWEEEKRTVQKQINEAADAKDKEELRRTLEWMRKVDMAVVVSEEAGEEEKFTKEGLDIKPHRKRLLEVDENGQEVQDKFKKPEDPLQLVFVCSMWLTGFDAETVSTLYMDKPMKDHTLMQTIARANRVTEYKVNGKEKYNGLVVDYYGVFRNLKKAFASYGGGNVGGDEKETQPAQEKEQLFVLLGDAINECIIFCKGLDIELDEIIKANKVFKHLDLFVRYADIILATDEQKRQFAVYDNTIDALYEACKPEIMERKTEYKMASVIHYLRGIIDGKVDSADLDNAKRRISKLLDESIVTDDEFKNRSNIAAEDKPSFGIKAWKQIDLSQLNMDKLREEFKKAEYKNIEIADLRAFISDKLQQLMQINVTRVPFAQRMQEIIDRYNAGGAVTEDYFNDLMNFMEQLRDEEERHIREGLSETELELFDLLKKENLTKAEEQEVKLAAKNLLKRLTDEKPTVLVNDWHKDTQTKIKVDHVIGDILEKYLPESYDRIIFKDKCNTVFQHFYLQAVQGGNRNVA
jgi:type I restriction enzyme, R subunit